MTKYISRAAIAAAALALGVSAASADNYSKTGNLNVTMTLSQSCSVIGGSLAFGPLIDNPSGITGNGSITVSCTTGTLYDVDLGLGNGGIAANRVMSDNASPTPHHVAYNIYSDVDGNHSRVWGSTMTGGKSWADNETPGTSRTGTGIAETIGVIGRIDNNQSDAVSGSYSDTVLITVNY